MDEVILRARAKINLSLDVLGKYPNGYHEVKMVMQNIGIYDRLIVKKIPEDDIRLRANLFFLPVNENNLIYRAAKMLKDEFGIKEGIEVDLNKFIPVSAGLAGGSTDAASTLVAMNRLFDLKLSMAKLMEYGVQLGADVPYCLLRGTALAEGIGEKLTKLKPLPKCNILIAKPPINVSTRMVYENLDAAENLEHPRTDDLLAAIDAGDIYGVAQNMGNVLESVTVPMYPVIDTIKSDMLNRGAINAMMSGSGPTVFGIFKNQEDCIACQNYLKEKGDAKQVYYTESYNPENGRKMR